MTDSPDAKNKMTGRERVLKALNYEPVDRIPVDIGGTPCSGAHVSVVANLRKALGLASPGERAKVVEPYQMLGEVDGRLRSALELDVVNLPTPRNMFGYKNTDWKPWRTFDGTDVLVPGKFNTTPGPNGDILMYPQGDESAAPSAKMPNGGYYFDSIIRQKPIDDTKLNPADNLEDFGPISDEDLAYYERASTELYNNTDLAVACGFGGAAFGDIALVPAPWMKDPKGIRDIEEWYISTVTRQDYIREVFAFQADVAVQNLARLYRTVGDKVTVIQTNGSDFGTQNGPFCSPDTYRTLYLPFQKKVNGWIHANTPWKTLMHCCGGIRPLLPLIIEAEFDILNPVQCSAQGMEPQALKDDFGRDLVFWGGGVDTQHTLPFGTPQEVETQVRERIEIFSRDSGFVFSTIHNIVANCPVDNVIAMFETLREYR